MSLASIGTETVPNQMSIEVSRTCQIHIVCPRLILEQRLFPIRCPFRYQGRVKYIQYVFGQYWNRDCSQLDVHLGIKDVSNTYSMSLANIGTKTVPYQMSIQVSRTCHIHIVCLWLVLEQRLFRIRCPFRYQGRVKYIQYVLG